MNELLLEKISNGKYEQNQIKIDSIFGGKWSKLIFLPPYFPPDSLSNCGVEQDIIRKIKRHSPLELDIEETRIYFVYSNNAYELTGLNWKYMLLNVTSNKCQTFTKGDLLVIENIARDSSHVDYRVYKKNE